MAEGKPPYGDIHPMRVGIAGRLKHTIGILIFKIILLCPDMIEKF